MLMLTAGETPPAIYNRQSAICNASWDVPKIPEIQCLSSSAPTRQMRLVSRYRHQQPSQVRLGGPAPSQPAA